MYENFIKAAQEGMKPMLKMAENSVDMTVKLKNAQAETSAELLQANLAHFRALVEAKDLNAAVEMQQNYVESVNEKLVDVTRDNAAVVEAAISEAGSILKGSMADVQAQAKTAAESLNKGIDKVKRAAKKAA